MAAYGTDQGFTDWLAANGLSLPAGAPSIATLRAIGTAYTDGAYEYRLFCSKRTGGVLQENAWPRTGARMNRTEHIPDDLIPVPWINASYRAGYLQATSQGWAQGGLDTSRVTKREKVDTIEREFFEAGKGGGESNAAPGFRVDPLIDGWVSIWLCPIQSGQGIWAIGT